MTMGKISYITQMNAFMDGCYDDMLPPVAQAMYLVLFREFNRRCWQQEWIRFSARGLLELLGISSVSVMYHARNMLQELGYIECCNRQYRGRKYTEYSLLPLGEGCSREDRPDTGTGAGTENVAPVGARFIEPANGMDYRTEDGTDCGIGGRTDNGAECGTEMRTDCGIEYGTGSGTENTAPAGAVSIDFTPVESTSVGARFIEPANGTGCGTETRTEGRTDCRTDYGTDYGTGYGTVTEAAANGADSAFPERTDYGTQCGTRYGTGCGTVKTGKAAAPLNTYNTNIESEEKKREEENKIPPPCSSSSEGCNKYI